MTMEVSLEATQEIVELDYECDDHPVDIEDTEKAAAKQDVGSCSSRGASSALEVSSTDVKNQVDIISKLDREGAQFWREDVIVSDATPSNDAGIKVLKDLSVDSSHTRASVTVTGVKGIPDFEVTRIFARYKPTTSVLVNEDNAIVQFASCNNALQMFIHMTQSLRFQENSEKGIHEEGEVESDDDEGEIMKENGKETVYLVDDKSIVVGEDEVRIDSGRYAVPKGEWRAVVKHVPGNKILLIRYATGTEVEGAGLSVTKREAAEGNTDRDGYEYKWSSEGQKIRPGLNVFDSKGRELDWDYEHDTRFYDDKSAKKNEEQNDDEWRLASNQCFSTARKVKGRGAKRFLGEDSKTMTSDGDVPLAQKRHAEDAEDWSADPSSKPSDQPWNKKSRLAGRLQKM